MTKQPVPVVQRGEWVYVFNHVPRTGGVSLGSVLASWGRPVWDYQAGPGAADRERWLRSPLDLEALPGGSVVLGHYTGPGGRLRERYPQVFASPRYRLITVLRTPWALAQSHADRAIADGGDSAGVEQVVLSVAGIYAKNLGRGEASDPALLCDYWFVGFTEELQAVCDALADRLARPRRGVPVSNASRARLPLPSALRRQFNDVSRADRRIYATARRMALGPAGCVEASERR